MEGIAPSRTLAVTFVAAALLILLAPARSSDASGPTSAVTSAPVSPLPLAAYAVRWAELEVAADSLHLDEIAANEAGRDSLRASLASQLAAWTTSGARGWDELPASAADWIRARVREGFVLADPKWEPFARATAAKSAPAGLLSRIDPSGDWTLPGTLFLLSHHAESADRWIQRSVWPPEDRPFLAVLATEARAAGVDLQGGAALADSLLALGGWPTWTEEPLEETAIDAALARKDWSDAERRLVEYGARFAKGPWFYGTSETLARRAGRTAEADSLAWKIARSYPGSARARSWLEEQVPLDQSLSGLTKEEIEVLLEIASETRGVTRYLLLSEEYVRKVAASQPSGNAARAEKSRLDLRAAELAYRARRYEDLFDALQGGRIAPTSAWISRWGLVLGRAYRNTGQPDSMAVWFDKTATNGSSSDRNDALWEWGRELESLRRFADAEAVYERMAKLGAGDKSEDVPLRIGFTRYQEKRYADAEAAFATVASSSTAWRVATAEFWRYRCRLAMGDEAGARAALQRAARAPDGYYASRAQSALAMEPRVPITDIEGYWREVARLAEVPALSEIPYRADMGSNLVNDELPANSLEQKAERLWLFRQYGRGPWAARALDDLDADAGLGNGLDRVETLHTLGFPDLAARRVIRMNRGEAELRYPAPYAAAVASAARRGGLAPEWMWAVMRRESFFEATVQSPAGALGLMQFMQATADKVGKENGLPSEPLSSPVVNLALGITHLRELVDETNGDWPQILAGYNAGMHNAVRWIYPDEDPDVFIEMIGYRETRDYVKAVLEGFWIYRRTLRVPGIQVPTAEVGASPAEGRAP